MICSCCGYEIEDEPHLIEDGRYVCDRCWKNPSLFFPGKLEQDERLRILSKLSQERKLGSLKVQVIRLSQKDIDMYMGKMAAKELLELCAIDRFKEEELKGYQRQQYEERTSELLEYLTECPIALMPALFVSVRDATFTPTNGDLGVLEIQRRKGSIWIIDGQHRIGGFEKICDCFESMQNPEGMSGRSFLNLMNYELPVVFVNSKIIAKKLNKWVQESGLDVTSEDVERAIFFITNKTQKGIQPSLKDALLYCLKISGITGLPILRKESWRIEAAYIGIMLNQDANSPLFERINLSGKRGSGRPIQLNSFVSSLRRLFLDKDFSRSSRDERLKFIRAYWGVLRKMFPYSFEEKTWRQYMLLKAIGVYCLNWLAQRLCCHAGHRGIFAKLVS
ncbi:MAG: hypothetical protein AOA66_1538 [Candidatus Bathyarchaeota archaeon BA2]|nr:MAG: hypothetical protein AOA66_1538 [Candidatus Bathyarchaeota archaeon BA2]